MAIFGAGKQATLFESRVAEVGKVPGRKPEGGGRARDDILRFSTEVPKAKEELADLVALAARERPRPTGVARR